MSKFAIGVQIPLNYVTLSLGWSQGGDEGSLVGWDLVYLTSRKGWTWGISSENQSLQTVCKLL